MKLKDHFWIWGHHAGCHHTGDAAAYKIPGENRMGPWEGAEYLGIPNCCRVVFNGIPEPLFDEESEKLKNFKKVIWSVLGDASSMKTDISDVQVNTLEIFPFCIKHISDRCIHFPVFFS